MKVSEREISRQMKVRKTAVPNTIKNFKKKYFQGQQKNRPSEHFCSGNKRFIRKRVSQSLKNSAEKNTS